MWTDFDAIASDGGGATRTRYQNTFYTQKCHFGGVAVNAVLGGQDIGHCPAPLSLAQAVSFQVPGLLNSLFG